MSRSLSILFLSSVLLSAGHCTPVLIWNADVNRKAVFPQIEQQEFLQEIKPLYDNKAIVAFTYDKLTLRDFRCVDCFEYLSAQTPTFFYANVEKPGEALRSLGLSGEIYIEANGRFEHTLECRPGKLYMISLDVFKRAINPMKSCDDAIETVISFFACADAAYAFLGIHEEATELSGRLHQSGKLSFYITELYVEDLDGLQNIETQYLNVTGDDPKLMAELQVENSTQSLQFDVHLSSGYFTINSFKFNDTTYYVFDLYAPTTHSFSCGKIVLESNKKKLILKRVQIQYDVEPHQAYFKFKDAWTCEGFTSPAIVSGLFIAVILLGILSVGVSMLLSVQPPTKFENAGGPTIHINVVDK